MDNLPQFDLEQTMKIQENQTSAQQTRSKFFSDITANQTSLHEGPLDGNNKIDKTPNKEDSSDSADDEGPKTNRRLITDEKHIGGGSVTSNLMVS